MRGLSLLPPLALAGMLTLPAPGFAQQPGQKADTAPDLSKLLDIKPFPVGDSDAPLLKLQKERFNARLEAARLQLQAVRAGALNTQQFNDLLTMLATNAVEVERKPEDKVRWLQMRVDVLKSQEAIARKRTEAGVENASATLLAKAARIDAEIDLLKLKESMKGDKADKGSGGRK
jgi:hypothetical protein